MYAFGRKIGIVILILAALKICHVHARNVPSISGSRAQAFGNKKLNGNNPSSYYRRNPYGPNTYAFGFEVHDSNTNNIQFRDERRYSNGTVEGSYGYLRPDGRVTVTHFVSDKANGYLSQTQTFDSDDEYQWNQHWPTKKPAILTERPEGLKLNVTYDKDRHLNMTQGGFPDHMVDAVRQQYGVDLNKVDLQKDIIDPTVLDIVNGKVPLQKQGNRLGFETVHDFIPPDFPIKAFQLPEKLEEKIENEQNNEIKNKEMVDTQKTNETKGNDISNSKIKYDRAKDNNAEKSLDVDNVRDESSEPETENDDGNIRKLPKSLPDSDETGTRDEDWYEKIIANNRKEFLLNLPELF